MKTDLKGRTLWYDGTNVVPPELVPSLILCGVSPDKIIVTEKNEDIVQFDAFSDIPIGILKDENDLFDDSWKLPAKYLNLDLEKLTTDIIEERKYPQPYTIRVRQELEEIEKRNIGYLFRALYYVITTFKDKGIIWGIGRGSSCASLILFLIGVHNIDPVKYNIPLEEFFH